MSQSFAEGCTWNRTVTWLTWRVSKLSVVVRLYHASVITRSCSEQTNDLCQVCTVWLTLFGCWTSLSVFILSRWPCVGCPWNTVLTTQIKVIDGGRAGCSGQPRNKAFPAGDKSIHQDRISKLCVTRFCVSTDHCLCCS